jgi:hypothetical protein
LDRVLQGFPTSGSGGSVSALTAATINALRDAPQGDGLAPAPGPWRCRPPRLPLC